MAYGFWVELEVEGADSEEVLGFETVRVTSSAFGEHGESLLKLVILHKFLALEDGSVSESFSLGLLGLENAFS